MARMPRRRFINAVRTPAATARARRSGPEPMIAGERDHRIAGRSGRPPALGSERLERARAGVARRRSELLLDPDELVVFGRPVGAGERNGLDLPAIRRDGELGDGRVLGLAGAV